MGKEARWNGASCRRDGEREYNLTSTGLKKRYALVWVKLTGVVEAAKSCYTIILYVQAQVLQEKETSIRDDSSRQETDKA